MIAKVIVDVPSRQTDRPFDYEVPAALEEWIEVGSRVGVPFGGRVLQGFVTQLTDTTDVAISRIKPVSELLDHVPPLLPDLIELAQWMSEKYCCSWTTALQAMIPAALKGKAERLIGIQDVEAAQEDLPPAMTEWIGMNGQLVKLEVLLERFPDHAKAVKAALREGVLIEQTSIRDRHGIRKVLTVYVPDDVDAIRAQLQALPARAAKQREVLAHMLEHGVRCRFNSCLRRRGICCKRALVSGERLTRTRRGRAAA